MIRTFRDPILSAPTPRSRRGGVRGGGFTLIELMVVIALVAILSALAAPSMSKLVASQRVRTAATDFHLTLVKTRAEAIKRNRQVTLRPVNDSWMQGWNILDPENPTDNPPLQVQGSLPNISVTSSLTELVYNARGRTTQAEDTPAMFVFSSARTDFTRCVSIDATGRPYVKEGSTC